MSRARKPGVGRGERYSLITGGAGFIGTNLADRLLSEGKRVHVLDSLVRPGVEENLAWLQERHPARCSATIGDVRDPLTLRDAVRNADAVFHLAAQVAVTTSVLRPVEDCAVNLEATVRLLEELRRLREPPPLLFTSTNKVYGTLGDVELSLRDERWEPASGGLRATGVDERRPLDFCTPYGCSKGAADQYVLDYAKSFGLRTVVFRMSCIYGFHQHGNEDQGWVAHFLLRALAGEALTVYGDGGQVRDVLFAADLVEAMLLARRHVDELSGRAFNIGGGPSNTISLLELLALIEELHGEAPPTDFAEERMGDQRWYVSDTTRFSRATGWTPAVGVRDGVSALYDWLSRARLDTRLEAVV